MPTRRFPALCLTLSLTCAAALVLAAAPARTQVLNNMPLTGPTIQPDDPAQEEEQPKAAKPDEPKIGESKTAESKTGESKTETEVEPSDEPLDLTTPVPGSLRLKAPSVTSPVASAWDGKAGIDKRRPSIPAADWLPEQLAAGAIPDQSAGVAWANVTAPGLDSPLSWDKAAIDTRLDPTQEQGKVGTTLTRSVPVSDDLALTLQNGVAVTRTLPSAGQPAAQSWASSQAVRFNILPTDTTVSIGADITSTDERWLRTLSAEQKLLGGPLSVTGAVSETASGESAKSVKGTFKRTW
jgi:hypothetical protein